MKKICLFLLLILAIGINSMAVDKVVANWDGKNPVATAVDPAITAVGVVANPNSGGINTSANVFEVSKIGGARGGAFIVTFDSMKLHAFPVLKVKVYANANVNLRADLVTTGGVSQVIPIWVNPSINKTTPTPSAWYEYILDMSLYIKPGYYNQIKLQVDNPVFKKANATDSAAVDVYFDDITLSSLKTTGDSAVIAAETGGAVIYKQDGSWGPTAFAGSPAICGPIPFDSLPNGFTKYAADSFHMSYVPGNTIQSVVMTRYNRGNDTWYPSQWFLPATYTKLNGDSVLVHPTLANGNFNTWYSIWMANSLEATSRPYDTLNYPSPTIIQAGAIPNSAYCLFGGTGYNGRWDTMEIDNINIKGFSNLAMAAGFAARGGGGSANLLNVLPCTFDYNIDGAGWISIDSTSILHWGTGFAGTMFFKYPVAVLPAGLTGNSMNIRYAMRNPVLKNYNRYIVDDMRVTGKIVPITSIAVSEGTKTLLDMQMDAAVTAPANAYETGVTWSITSGTAATINEVTGVLTGIPGASASDVTVQALANDGSGILGTHDVTIGPLLTDIKVLAPSDSIKTKGGIMQLGTDVTSKSAWDTTVVWSIVRTGAGNATITQSGLVSATSNGDIYAKATATDGSGMKDSVKIGICCQVLVTDVNITSGDSIKTNDGNMTLTAEVLPSDAPDLTVTWSIVSADADTASLAGDVLTAIRNGSVTLRAASNANPSIYDEKTIVLVNQVVELDSIKIKGAGNATTITTDDGALQMNITYYPADAANKAVTWASSNTNVATINTSGLLQALRNGSTNVSAVAADGGKTHQVTITVSNQIICVASISVNTSTFSSIINTDGGTLQMTDAITPTDATDKTVTWSLSDPSLATITSGGLLTAVANGSETVTATSATPGTCTAVTKTKIITISNQPPTGINSMTANMRLYPNPVRNRLTISNTASINRFEIVNIIGEVVISASNNSSELSVDVSNLNNGIYIIHAYANNNVYMMKFIKK